MNKWAQIDGPRLCLDRRAGPGNTPWPSNDGQHLPWHLGLDALPWRREAFSEQGPRFKSGTKQATYGGLCRQWRASLPYKGFPESQGSPPEISGPASAPRGGWSSRYHLNAESPAWRRPDLAICHTQPASS